MEDKERKAVCDKLTFLFKQKFYDIEYAVVFEASTKAFATKKKVQETWSNYLNSLNEIEKVGKLLALVLVSEKIRIKDPSPYNDSFLEIPVDFALKTVTLGFLP